MQKVFKSCHQLSIVLLLVGASGCAGGGMSNSVGTAGSSQALQVGRAVASVMPGTASKSDLTSILAQQLGVTQPQAAGGAGAIFQLAKSQMRAAAFAKLSHSVPGMQGLLAAAPAVNSVGGGLGGIVGKLGGLSGNSGNSAGNLIGLASSFQQLGLSPSMVQQFVPIILQYVQGTGGGGVSNLLQTTLMGGS